MNYLEELKQRLDAAYAQRRAEWLTKPPEYLIDNADEIAAVNFIHEDMVDELRDYEARFLMTLDDPLGKMADKWVEENGSEMVHDDDLRHCVYSLADGYGLDLEAFEEGGDMRLC